MFKQIAWNTFKKTGNINTFMEFKQLKDLEKKIKTLGLENQVYLLGRKTNPYIWLKNADIFIHSSKREGFPAVLLEAMACRKMVISSKCPTGPKEILEDGKVGELYEVGDTKTLAEKLEKYLLNPEQKEKYITNSQKRINDFEKKRVLENYKIFLDEVLRK